MKGKHLKDYFTPEEWEARRERIRREVKKRWQDTDYKKRVIKSLALALKKKPNKPEMKLWQLLKSIKLPYRFVGDGQIVIGGYVPDFIDTNNKKHIIELFGDYWHSDEREIAWHQTELGRSMAYGQFGYKTLIIWEHELDDTNTLTQKLLQFERGK